MSEDYYLLLKWGTIKGWNIPDGKPLDLLSEIMSNKSMSAMANRLNDNEKERVCELIDGLDKLGASFQNDWCGTKYTAQEAKDYIINYGESKND